MRFALICALALSALPVTALAESAPPACVPGGFFPAGNHVPANLPGFLYRSDYVTDPAEVLSLTRYRDDDSTSEPVAFEVGEVSSIVYREWIVILATPLEEGWTYVFSDASCTMFSGVVETTFFVDPAVSLPETLGVTNVSELRSQRGSPYEPIRYFVVVRLEPAPGVEALTELMRLALAVNAVIDPNLDAERIYTTPYELTAECGPFAVSVLHEGPNELRHEARFHASRSPDLVTPMVSVEVVCEDAVRVRPGTDVPLTDAEIAEADRLPDGTLAPPEGAPVPTPGMSGGGCSAVPGSTRGGLVMMALLLGLALRRRFP